MKHRVTWLAIVPLALAMANFVEAGFHCGGCSDPCRPARHHGCGILGGHAHHGSAHGCSSVGHSGLGYAGHSVVQASPASCGAVAADGSYGISSAQQIVQSTVVVQSAAPSAAVSVGPQIVCEPVTGYRTVMESTFVTETQYVTATETKQETRTRVKKVSKSIPITFEDYRTKTVLVPTTETKTIEYSVLVPEQSTKTVDVNVSVPVWNEIVETYTVKVPKVSDVEESYNVTVPRLKDESFTYTVYAPQTETVTKVQTVTNAVPVVKTRTIQRNVPSYSTQTVTRDAGHWETVVEEVAGSSYGAAPTTACATSQNVAYAAPQGSIVSGGCSHSAVTTVVSGGGCGNGLFARHSHMCNRKTGCGTPAATACATSTCASKSATGTCGCGSNVSNSCGSAAGSACSTNAIVSGNVMYGTASNVCGTTTSAAVAPATRTTTRKVWVPNVVTEEVPVVTNEVRNEEVAYTVYEQQSTQIPYECAYVVYRPEQRTGTKKVVEYVSEPRTRTRKVVSYTDEQRTRTRRELSYKTETKQETYPVVTYKTEKKTKEISFTLQVPTQVVEPFQSTRYENVTEDVVEEYTVNVQVPTTKEVQVQVCKMVPKLVPYTFNPCSVSTSSTNSSVGGCGCGTSVPAAPVAHKAASGCDCGAATLASPCKCPK